MAIQFVPCSTQIVVLFQPKRASKKVWRREPQFTVHKIHWHSLCLLLLTMIFKPGPTGNLHGAPDSDTQIDAFVYSNDFLSLKHAATGRSEESFPFAFYRLRICYLWNPSEICGQNLSQNSAPYNWFGVITLMWFGVEFLWLFIWLGFPCWGNFEQKCSLRRLLSAGNTTMAVLLAEAFFLMVGY